MTARPGDYGVAADAFRGIVHEPVLFVKLMTANLLAVVGSARRVWP